MPPKKALTPKLSKQTKPSSSSQELVLCEQAPSPKPHQTKSSWYDLVTQEEEDRRERKDKKGLNISESVPNLSIEQMVELTKANPALMNLEVFQNAVEEFTQKNLQQIDLKQKSVVEFSAPPPRPYFQKKAATKYIDKTLQQLILTIEDEYFEKTPRLVAEKIFPPGWHFQPKNPMKNQKFYEIILMDTGSVSIKHHMSPSNPSEITHSSVQILNVLTLEEWNEHPSNFKRLSQNYTPQLFNYWEYQNAWHMAFLFKNQDFKHSWFFYFKPGVNYKFPYWFASWWDYFGPVSDILPPPVQEGYEFFCQNAQIESRQQKFPSLLNFFSMFSLSWILCWEYSFLQNPPFPVMLARTFKVKWWQGFDSNKASKAKVMEWISQSKYKPPSIEVPTAKFLEQKTYTSSRLANAKSKQEYRRLLLESLAQLEEEEEHQESLASSSSSSSPPLNTEEVIR